jgi:hypothetical protein
LLENEAEDMGKIVIWQYACNYCKCFLSPHSYNNLLYVGIWEEKTAKRRSFYENKAQKRGRVLGGILISDYIYKTDGGGLHFHFFATPTDCIFASSCEFNGLVSKSCRILPAALFLGVPQVRGSCPKCSILFSHHYLMD